MRNQHIITARLNPLARPALEALAERERQAATRRNNKETK